MEITELTFVPQEGKRLSSTDPRRKFVRSHVSRRINVKKRKEGGKREEGEETDQAKEDRKRSESVDTRSSPENHVAKRTPEPGCAGDPFGSLPIEAGQCELLLLKYYASTWHKVRIPINPARAYLPIAISNPALLHVTLLHAAMNSPFLCDPKFQTTLAYHKLKSVEAVNEKISKSAFDTFTLATVALLALLESADGTENACRAHMTGLSAIAKHVGGLEIDTLNPLLRQTIRWIDVAGAMTLESPLIFSSDAFKNVWNDVKFEKKTLIQANNIVEKLHLITDSLTLSQSVGTIFQHLKWLSNGINKIPTSDVAGLEKLHFNTRLDHLERQCINLRNLALLQTTKNLDLIIAFSNASLIYICLIIRGYQRRLGMFEVLAQRMRNAIESIDWLMVDEALPDMLLWIMMVASLAVEEGEKKRWFNRRVRSIGGSMGLFTANDLAEKVKSFLWVETFMSREGLWQEGVDGLKVEMD